MSKLIEEGNHTTLILGLGGMGKTYFTKRLLLNLAARKLPYFVLDPVGQYQRAYGRIYSSRAALQGEVPRQVIFQWRTIEDFDSMSQWLYDYSIAKPQNQRIYVIVEEAQISLGHKSKHPLIDLVLTGRGNNVYLVLVNRALVGLSSVLFDSTTSLVLFKLKNTLTLTKLDKSYNIDTERIRQLPDHARLIYRV